MAKDYYAILGVEKNAGREEIKKAYKKLAKKWHPDLNKEDPEAEKHFKEINEAAAILGDEEKRRQYDSVGHEAFTQGARTGGPSGFDFSGFHSAADFDDLFENLGDIFGFGDIFGGRRRGRARRGADLRYDLTITLDEAAFGTTERITVRKQERCGQCDGSGGSKVETCSTCHGTGYVRQTKRTPFGIFQTTGACPACRGEGREIREPCDRCGGSGLTLETKELDVDIPAGVHDGMRLRIGGEGEAGPRGAPPGDLYLFITVEAHGLFERHGDDIYLEAPISFFQATFGDEVELPTLEGKAKLKVPAGTQSGTLFRLRGKGVTRMGGHGRGDQLVKVLVVTPTKLSRKQRRALEAAQEEFGDGGQHQKGLFEKLKEKLS